MMLRRQRRTTGLRGNVRANKAGSKFQQAVEFHAQFSLCKLKLMIAQLHNGNNLAALPRWLVSGGEYSGLVVRRGRREDDGAAVASAAFLSPACVRYQVAREEDDLWEPASCRSVNLGSEPVRTLLVLDDSVWASCGNAVTATHISSLNTQRPEPNQLSGRAAAPAPVWFTVSPAEPIGSALVTSSLTLSSSLMWTREDRLLRGPVAVVSVAVVSVAVVSVAVVSVAVVSVAVVSVAGRM
ncbi:hypothetical protein F2P81_013315 [Scophthalmus maximus]|uniref:Uncharacterized protein n=1 Tax=Scophthalmus maximus TaxID=52904 RepID=A0A6A4SQD3_SCOMX|nr:hypothetical protein F2P81_013315 [Scophthalmus maximus]